MSKHVYVAGPLFSKSERDWDERVAEVCELLNFETFLPHRDVGLQVEGNADHIFTADLRALDRAQIVVGPCERAAVPLGQRHLQ